LITDAQTIRRVRRDRSDECLGNAGVGVGDVEGVFFDVVQALVCVQVWCGFVAGQLDGLEVGLWGEVLRKIGSGGVVGVR
jgi:hypothetical protein